MKAARAPLRAATPSPAVADRPAELSPADAAFKCVHQIKTATDADAPKASYGSGFVIAKDGLIATNFHVVADALRTPKHYRVFLVDGTASTEVKIVRFSAVDDIAIVRAAKTFPCALEFAKDEPKVGERINSIGLPQDLNKAIIEGTYNGEASFGPFSEIEMSSPLNAGMSGGPTINKKGEVIGLNVAILDGAQSLAFAVPLSRLRALLAEREGLYPEQDGKDTFHPALEAQMYGAQEILTRAFQSLDNPKDHGLDKTPRRIGSWVLPKMPSYYKCWRKSDRDVRERSSSVRETCFLGHAVQLGGGARSSFIVAQWNSIDNQKLSPLQLYHEFNGVTRMTANAVSGQDFDPDAEAPFAGGTCRTSRILNRHNILFSANYCLSAYKDLSGLYEGRIVAASLSDSGHLLSLGIEANGFTEANLKKLLLNQLNAVDRAP